MTTEPKISGAVIPRRVFTQSGSKPEWPLTPLMSAFAGFGHSGHFVGGSTPNVFALSKDSLR